MCKNCSHSFNPFRARFARFTASACGGELNDRYHRLDVGAQLLTSARWQRRQFVRLLQALIEDRPKAIFLDALLMEGGSMIDNRYLANTVEHAGNVIVGFYFDLAAESMRIHLRTVRDRVLSSLNS